MKSEVFNMDCLAYMQSLPDKHFDLAIVDPPYGLGIDGQKLNNTNKNPKHNRKSHAFKGWDNEIPTKEYFHELFRVSKNQIIWGGNYFPLPLTKAWVFWYKGQNGLTMSDGELAWTSFDTVTRQCKVNRFELKGSIHPTQKPVALYKWLLQNYAKKGDKIFDSHMGSQSSRLATWEMGFDFWGCELDKEYFEAGNKRFEEFKLQQRLFAPEELQPVSIGANLFGNEGGKPNRTLK